MYKYTYKTRGFSIGCQPKGFIKIEQEEHKFETVYYDRKLTEQEIIEYELIDLNQKQTKGLDKMNELKFQVTVGGSETYVMTSEEIIDMFYDNGYGVTKNEIIEILENKHPMYEVRMIIE